jgi:hypothetical protein
MVLVIRFPENHRTESFEKCSNLGHLRLPLNHEVLEIAHYSCLPREMRSPFNWGGFTQSQQPNPT